MSYIVKFLVFTLISDFRHQRRETKNDVLSTSRYATLYAKDWHNKNESVKNTQKVTTESLKAFRDQLLLSATPCN